MLNYPGACFFFLYLLTLANNAYCQLPTCSGSSSRYIYLHGPNGDIYTYDPALPVSMSNPALNFAGPALGMGLAVSTNLNAATPLYTFYTVGGAGASYTYFDGSAWQQTGHTAGNANPAGGGGYVYNLNASNGDVWKYDGSGNATIVVTVSGVMIPNTPVDLAADCYGNFYILTTSTPQMLRKYNSAGVLQNTWTVTGLPAPMGGGGMAIIGNNVYANNTFNRCWIGVINGSNVHFKLLTTAALPSQAFDFASCPAGEFGTNPVRANVDTAYYCGYGPGVPINAIGAGPFTWSVLSGPAVISGSGAAITVTATASSRIVLQTSDVAGSCTYRGMDIIDIIVPKPTITAITDTLLGCGTYLDTMRLLVTDTLGWCKYGYAWSPATAIASGINTINPVIQPNQKTVYKLTTTTGAAHGACTWQDSFTVSVKNAKEKLTDFSFDLKPGCKVDTVHFNNQTTTGFPPQTFNWYFDDGTPADTTKHAVHIYQQQGSYNVLLVSKNKYCSDTVSKPVVISHPLNAIIQKSDSVICVGDTIYFNASNSVISQASQSSYYWHFGDGTGTPFINPSHSFTEERDYNVMLIVTDSIPCSDTAYDKIVVKNEGKPTVYIGPRDTVLCDDEQLVLPIGTSVGVTRYTWSNGSEASRFVVNGPGIYYVTVFNSCGQYADTIAVSYKNCKLWFPGAFTPNDDGVNDIARLLGNLADISEFEFKIYNRWGNAVFSTNDTYKGWDGIYNGVPQAGQAYYYLIRFKFQAKPQLMKGDIILVR